MLRRAGPTAEETMFRSNDARRRHARYYADKLNNISDLCVGGVGIVLGNLGNVYVDIGEPERAVELYERQLAIARADAPQGARGLRERGRHARQHPAGAHSSPRAVAAPTTDGGRARAAAQTEAPAPRAAGPGPPPL